MAAPIGILGGTFDPIHFAHLRLGEELADRLDLAEVRFVPARLPPHRATPNVTAENRLQMTRLATAGNPRFNVDDRECRRDGPSYTIDTLHEFRAELGPARPLCLLMGVDAYLGLTTWSRWLQLYEVAHIVVAHRPGFALETRTMPGALAQQTVSRMANDAQALRAQPGGLVLALDIPSLDVSGTAIRALIRAGHSARYLLPDDVLDYIGRNRLYKDFDAD